MASIFTKNNKLYIAVMLFDPDSGKKKQKKKSTGLKDTPANRKLVKNKILPKYEKEIRKGNIELPKKQITIKELCNEYLELKKSSNIREYTIKEYSKMFENHILPIFSNKTPISITPNDIDRWQMVLIKEKN